MVDILAGRPKTDLEGVIFSLVCRSLKRTMAVVLYPFIGQIRCHADRVTPVFRKQNIGILWLGFQQVVFFFGSGDHLHRVERMEFIDGLELLDGSLR